MSGNDTQTQTTNSEPYAAAKPLLNKGMGDALNLYNNGGLVKANTQSTVVPFSQQSMAGMGSMQQGAEAAMQPGGLSSQFGSIIQNGGFNDPQKTALQGIQSTATSQFDPWNNPAFRQVLDQSLDSAKQGVNANASAMGRYGSGTHQGTMQREQGNLASRMIGDEYRNWQGRTDAAQQQLFNAGQQGMNNLMPSYEGMMAPGQTMMDIGGLYEDLMGRTMNDRLRISQEQQNLPLANIQTLLGIAGGGGNFGTQKTTAQMPGSTASNIMGGLLGGASLLQGLL